MSKHETIPTASSREPSEDLIQRVEDAYLEFRKENPGERYRRADLNKVIGTSFGPLCKAANIVEARLDALEAKLAVMPEMPGDLRRRQEQFLEELWVRARDLGTVEAVALKRAADESDAKHRRETEEVLDLLSTVETERDAALARADTVETALAEAEAENVRLAGELSAARATLEDRASFLAMLRDRPGDSPSEGGNAPEVECEDPSAPGRQGSIPSAS